MSAAATPWRLNRRCTADTVKSRRSRERPNEGFTWRSRAPRTGRLSSRERLAGAGFHGCTSFIAAALERKRSEGMKISANCIGILALVVGSACGAAEASLDSAGELPPSEEDTANEGGDSAALETLHHFELQGSTYRYLSAGGDV